MAENFLAAVIDGELVITATTVGDEIDSTIALETNGTDQTATDPSIVVDPQGESTAAVWTTPVRDGTRGPGRFSKSITLSDNTVPNIGSNTFNTHARGAITDILGAGTVPVAGDIVTITYTKSDDSVDTRNAIHDGTGVADNDWSTFALEIDGNLLVNGTIVTDKLAALSISTAKIQAGAVTANEVTLVPGDVGAGSKATSGSRMIMSSDKLDIFDGSTLRVRLGNLG